MGLKYRKKIHTRLITFSLILLGLILVSSINHPNNYVNNSIYQEDSNQNNTINKESLATSDLNTDNSFEGVGSEWDTTHWANRTDKELDVQFENNSYDQVYTPLFSGWEGYKLEANISDLYDTRNWNNGSFHFGSDDDTNSTSDDDNDITGDNAFQNWTFSYSDSNEPNVMGGNYFDETYYLSKNQDCLQLKMEGDYNPDGDEDRYQYDEGDAAWWSSFFHIPRGKLIDSRLEFDVNPVHLSEINGWEFRIYLNDVLVYSEGTKTIKDYGENQWHKFSVPQDLWINSSNVFTSTYLNDSDISIKAALNYSSQDAEYGPEDGENIDYQELFFDNIQLITEAETYPSNVSLMLNDTNVKDLSWGEGTLKLEGSWTNSKVFSNFSSSDVWDLGSFEKNQEFVDYYINLKANINLYATSSTGTVHETRETSRGTKFTIENNTNTEWLAYSYIEEPEDYSESLLKIDFPKDVNITFVGDPQDPSINILDLCKNDTKGSLFIPIENISTTPKGYWKLEAISPNYCKDLNVYNNVSGTWELNSTFLAGDYINITGEINNSLIIKDYIDKTKAKLEIRFPNGTIWDDQSQYQTVKNDGKISFVPFQIPENPPNYQVGEYEAIITWNNSYGINGMNETGLIYKKFSVKHLAKIIPESYYYEDNFENSTINLKVDFLDLEDSTPIENALVYTTGFDESQMLIFDEISTGFYFFEFNVTGGDYGNNTLKIYANSSDYINQLISIKIEIINQTLLKVEDDFLEDVLYNQNFTIEFNYTDKNTGIGIKNTTLDTNWLGDYHFNTKANGQYNLTCNTSLFNAGNLYNFYIHADAYKYEAQNISISVYISELGSKIELYLNGKRTNANEIFSVGVKDRINITVNYEDDFGNHLNNASVSLSAERFTKNLTENKDLNHYSIIIQGEELGQGLDNLNIFAQKTNYEPESVPFIIEISERATDLEIYLNSMNKTVDPFISTTKGSIVNLSIEYLDDTGEFIRDANVSASGDIEEQLNQNIKLKQYSLLINTSKLDVGTRKVRISAAKTNYQFQSKNIRIEINRIDTEINTVSGDSSVNLRPGENYTIQVFLRNLETNQSILGASINYTWIFGEGSLTDSDNNGIYETTLQNLPEGTYQIVITANIGEEYDVRTFTITLSISRPPQEFFAFQITLIISAAIAIALSSYTILYLKVLKYPKAVRKVRKFRKSLSKAKSPDINVKDRRSAFSNHYKNLLSKTPQNIDLSKKQTEGLK